MMEDTTMFDVGHQFLPGVRTHLPIFAELQVVRMRILALYHGPSTGSRIAPRIRQPAQRLRSGTMPSRITGYGQ